MIFNDRKGISHEIFFNVFELVLAFIVVLALFTFVNDVAKQTIFEKNYLSRDLAILVNTVYAAPGDLEYTYNENAGKSIFIFDFKPDKIEIYGQEEKESSVHVYYPFAENKNIPFRYKTLNSDKERVKIEFFKTNEYLDVDNVKLSSAKSDSSSKT